ncbi:hypothetical protein Tco_0383149 [Tanacetum coccineum]
MGRGYDKGHKAEQKQVEIMEDRRDKVQAEYHMDKEVNQAARDSDDALVCCVENTVEDRIMDSGASFHATYCKEELERFKLRSDKVRLADDKTLDIAGVGDVLDEEGYHVGFRDQKWKVTKGSFVVAHGNKRGSLYMVEVHPEGIDAIIDGSGSAALWFGEVEESFLHNVKEDKETAETATGVAVERDCDAEMVPETPLQFGVAERLSRTFRAESAGYVLRIPGGGCAKGCGSDEMRYSFRDTKSHQVIRSRDIVKNRLKLIGSKITNTNNVNAASINEVNVVGGKTSIELPFDPNMPALQDYSIFNFSRNNDDDGAMADMNNLDTTIQVSPIPT